MLAKTSKEHLTLTMTPKEQLTLTTPSAAPVAEPRIDDSPRRASPRGPQPRHVPREKLHRHRQRIMDPAELYFSPRWMAAGAAGAALGLLGLRQLGWPLAAGAGLLGALTWGHAKFLAPASPVLERVELRLPRLPAGMDGLRIGHLSDLHLGFPFTSDNVRWGLEQLERERPDLVVLTGDFVSFEHAIPEIAALLRGLSAPLGVYAVPGNHDYWEGVADVRSALAMCGIPLLMNESRRIARDGDELWLIGMDDIWDGRIDMRAALADVPEDAFTLMLAHTPDFVEEAALNRIDVQISGHTHGGHVRLPLLGPLAMPRYGRRFVMGQFQVGPTALYVSRGLGGSPLRFNCPPEATIITLRRP